MSQPVALAGKIHLTEDAFRKVMRRKGGEALASEIHQSLHQEYQNFYVFRYLKKEECLFFVFHYNYGDGELLKKAYEMIPLEKIGEADSKAEGYIFATMDSAGWDQRGNLFTYRIEGQKSSSPDRSPEKVWSEFSLYLDKYFYKEWECDFASNFLNGKIVDKSILRRYEILKEEVRLKEVIENLDKATMTRPVHFFKDYYFNGKMLYHSGGYSPVMLPEINPRNFVNKNYGGADEKHVVVEGRIVNCDPKSFKMLAKGETRYYKDKDQVYDVSLNVLEGADPKSFTLKNEYLAEDKYWVYYIDIQIPKDELGEFTHYLLDYHVESQILCGKGGIWIGKLKLDLDPLSFKFIEEFIRIGGPGSYYGVEDKTGQYMVYLENDKTKAPRLVKEKTTDFKTTHQEQS
ncbi:MAG: DKNYY domain-containing protein [Spirochaetales bacterium]|nr:DKNYY domain-containing protein [Spirochaetales bacterium]